MKNSEKIKRKDLKLLYKHRGQKSMICKAPFVSMSIGFDGIISPCCYTQGENKYNNEVFPHQSISGIWNGNTFKYFRELINAKSLPPQCSICSDKITRHEFDSLKTEEYLHYDESSGYPSIIEIAADNVCNLECIMCNSKFSSGIAKANNLQVETKINKELLFEELKTFVPHLKDIIFTGGEPVLSNFYYKIWQYIIDNNPEINITLNTNASILPDKFKTLIEKGNFHFNISLDTIDKEAYESIRVNAELEKTLNNFNYLQNYCIKKGTSLSVAVCPLIKNYKTIPELVEFCNQNNVNIFFVHVFNAYDVALSSASENTLKDATDILNTIKDIDNSNISKINYTQVRELISQIKIWQTEYVIRKQLIDAIKPDNNKFEFLKNNFKTKITKYLDEKSDDTKYNTNIIDKLDIILNQAPIYTKTIEFYQELDNLSMPTVIEIIENRPLKEILWEFESLFRKIISYQH